MKENIPLGMALLLRNNSRKNQGKKLWQILKEEEEIIWELPEI